MAQASHSKLIASYRTCLYNDGKNSTTAQIAVLAAYWLTAIITVVRTLRWIKNLINIIVYLMLNMFSFPLHGKLINRNNFFLSSFLQIIFPSLSFEKPVLDSNSKISSFIFIECLLINGFFIIDYKALNFYLKLKKW